MKLNTAYKEFKLAMTHDSHCSESGKNNSRLVFLGMYGFKGRVAEVMYRWYPGKGQYIQHLLGNHFSNSRMQAIYDENNLCNHIRYGSQFDPKKHKHIFVYAYLGMLMEVLDKEALEDFITSRFLMAELIESNRLKNKNISEQLKYLLRTKCNSPAPVVEVIRSSEVYTCTIVVDGEPLTTHQSKSLKYAKKKATEKALKYITSLDSEKLEEYFARKKAKEAEAIKQLNEKRHADFIARKEEQKAKRQERKMQFKLENLKKDKLRREAKNQSKKAKERKKESQLIITSDMNAAKRRRIEDKLK